MSRLTGGAPDAVIDEDRLWDDIMAFAEITEVKRPYTRRSFSPAFVEGRAWLADQFPILDSEIDQRFRGGLAAALGVAQQQGYWQTESV